MAQQDTLAAEVSGLSDRVYIADESYHLVHVDSALRERHGHRVNGVTCYEYLTHHDRPCSGCPLLNPDRFMPIDTCEVNAICMDRDGHPYEAVLRTTLLSEPDRQTVVGVVRDSHIH